MVIAINEWDRPALLPVCKNAQTVSLCGQWKFVPGLVKDAAAFDGAQEIQAPCDLSVCMRGQTENGYSLLKTIELPQSLSG